MKLFENITQIPQTIYTGGTTLGDQLTVYPGSTVKVETKEEEEYIRKTRSFAERKLDKKEEKISVNNGDDKKKFKS